MSQLPTNSSHSQPTKQDLASLVEKCIGKRFTEVTQFIKDKGGDNTICSLLGVNPETGINSSEASERKNRYGTNKIIRLPMKSLIVLMWDALKDFTRLLVLGSAILSLILSLTVDKGQREALREGICLLLVVIVWILKIAFFKSQKAKQMRKIEEISNAAKKVEVWRDGSLIGLNESELVVGDIVQITERTKLSADMMLVKGSSITTDESSLTGEPFPIKKNTYEECAQAANQSGETYSLSPALFSGTMVLSGEGKAVVLAVGENSFMGKLLAIIEPPEQDQSTSSPLQQSLETISQNIRKFGLITAIIMLCILLVRFFTALEDFEQYAEILKYLIITITVILAAIPEGLPGAVQISRENSLQKMLNDNILIKWLGVLETLGSVNEVCADKTGVLTYNKMVLTSLWNGRLHEIDSYKGGKLEELFNKNCHDLLKQALACNTSATLTSRSATDISQLDFLERYGENVESIRNLYINENTIQYPFDSRRKKISTIIDIRDDNNLPKKRLHVKGASEILLSDCTSFYNFDEGSCVPLTESMRETVEGVIESMGKQAMRTIGIAYKDLSEQEILSRTDDASSVEKGNLVLLGILAMKDTLRREVKAAVAECKAAGIKVRMLTGDNVITAKNIAEECGILDEKSIAITGSEFGDVDFNQIYPQLDVIARSTPEQKYKLVNGLQERGSVVAVIGDGTNDAPALKKASVGFALGSGTEVAKEASDIIILNDSFDSVVKAIKWGRNIHENIRKFVQFQLTLNIVAVGITVVGTLIFKEAVLTTSQVLWIHLIISTLASLAIATETPQSDILTKKPEPFLSNTMIKHIIGQALYQFCILMFLLFTADKWALESVPKSEHPELRNFRMVFNTFAFLQVFNLLNSRKLNDERNIFKGLSQNLFFIGIVFLMIVVQLIVDFGGSLISDSSYALGCSQWSCLLLASGSLIWSHLLKCLKISNGQAARVSRASLDVGRDKKND